MIAKIQHWGMRASTTYRQPGAGWISFHKPHLIEVRTISFPSATRALEELISIGKTDLGNLILHFQKYYFVIHLSFFFFSCWHGRMKVTQFITFYSKPENLNHVLEFIQGIHLQVQSCVIKILSFRMQQAFVKQNSLL